MKLLFSLIPTCFISLLLLGSCDSDSSSSNIDISNVDPTQRIHPQLQPYLNQFIQEAIDRGVPLNTNRMDNLIMRFEDLPAGTLGTCGTGNGLNEIIISNTISSTQYKWVAIHELGHCILRMLHRDDTLSIMNSTSRQSRLNQIGDQAAFDEFFQERFYEAY